MSISIYPNGMLLDKAEKVNFPLSEEDRDVLEEMAVDMEQVQGVGIGATQVGTKLRAFIIDKQVAGTSDHMVFINPEIISKSDETAIGEEGCLSIPGVSIKVKRHVGVKCSALDLEGNAFSVDAKDFYARAIQHEVDHLNGKLIIHYLGTAQRTMVLNKLKNYMRKAKRQAKELSRQSHQHG